MEKSEQQLDIFATDPVLLKTLEEAKQEVRDGRDIGITCPCCGQFAKTYRRKITSAMAYGLALMYNRKSHDYVHVEGFLKKIPNLPSSIRGDIAKLRHWGLIEAKAGEKEDGNPSNGYYKITGFGKLFVEKDAKAVKYIYLYNNKVVGSSDEMCTFTECLGQKFNYNEVVKEILW